MPKTKEQKRKEAMERNLASYNKNRLICMSYQTGGDLYKGLANLDGKEHADKVARLHLSKFKEWCNKNGIDTHTNKLN